MTTTQSAKRGRAPMRNAGPVADRPPNFDVVLIAVGVAAVSTSGPLIAATAAPALAIAFWRNAWATGVLLPAALWRRRAELLAMTLSEWRLAVLAGVLLAGHFATWVPSVTITSVASATALVATQPVWAALLARIGGGRLPGRAWFGIVVAVLGAGLLSGVDLSTSTRALGGDALALVGAGFAAAYVTVGARVRQTVSTTSYTAICYGTTALLLLGVCVVAGVRLAGYDAGAWWRIVALTVGAQLLGHSLFNVVLRTTSPTVVSLCILFEVPGAAIVAAAFLGQTPGLLAVPAGLLLLAGVALVVRSGAVASAAPVD